MCDDERRRILSDIQLLLEDCVEDFYANAVRDALSGSEEDFEKFLISNELWGGIRIAGRLGFLRSCWYR